MDVRRGSQVKVAARFAVAALVATLAVPMLPLTAGATSRYQQLQDQISQTRSKINAANKHEHSLMALLAQSDAHRAALEGTIARLTDQLAVANTALAKLDTQMAIAQTQLQLANDDLQAALARLDDQHAQVASRAAGLYMNSTQSYTTVLLGQHEFHDFMAASEYENHVFGADLSILEDIEAAKADVQVRRDMVAYQQELLRKQSDAITAQAKKINSMRQQQASAHNAIMGEINYRQHLLQTVRDQKQAYVDALDNLIAESDAIEALLNGAQAGQQVIAGAGHGYFIWPTSGRITSPYGWRIHPIYHYRSFHTGIDIGAPEGQGVIAARSGKILQVGYMGAYGLVVIIDHGNHIATVYAHLSRVYVHEGQWVSRRQLIAAVGTTGWSTGPHLHFEVRVNGQHVNPIRYL
jgi:murein DD-endopeptidase MepM/ murein hydrolase activator NlpD